MSISLTQGLLLILSGDGSSSSFSFDLTAPPLNVLLGQPDSVVAGPDYQGPQVSPVNIPSWGSGVVYSADTIVLNAPQGGVSSNFAIQATNSGTSGDGSGFPIVQAHIGQQIHDGTVIWVVISNPIFDTIPLTVSLRKNVVTLSFSRALRQFGSQVGSSPIYTYRVPLLFIYNG